MLAQLIVNAGADQKLLPSEAGTRAPDLRFQVNALPLADRMVAKIHEPGMQVCVLNGVRAGEQRYDRGQRA